MSRQSRHSLWYARAMHSFSPPPAPDIRVVIGWDLIRVGGELHLVGRNYHTGRPEVSTAIVDMDKLRTPTWVVAEDGQRYSLFQHGLRSPSIMRAFRRRLDEWGVSEPVRSQMTVVRFSSPRR